MVFKLCSITHALHVDELTPLASRLEAEISAKEEALNAKTSTERKSREFITQQRELVEKLQNEKVCAQNNAAEPQAAWTLLASSPRSKNKSLVMCSKNKGLVI